MLLHGQHEMLDKARKKLAKQRNGNTADDVVAALTFGFWVSLFNSPFEGSSPNQPQERLAWHDQQNHASPILLSAFPHAPKRFHSRDALLQHCNRILWLRNRVFHHEPIWNRPELDREHGNLIKTIGWVSHTMRDTILLCDQFPTVLNYGQAAAEAKIKAFLAMS